jgi:hypothetical protein
MAVGLRCWNCDNDLPSPPFTKWRGRQPGDQPGTVTCRTCGWRYELIWTAGGWKVVDAFRPGQSSPARR